MFYNIRDKVKRWKFEMACKGVYGLKPLKLSLESNVAILTLLQSKDLTMYLYALRSFVEKLPVGRIYIVNDGSLMGSDVAKLQYFIPKVTILSKENYHSKYCPTGGCWERLLAITEVSKEYYVIQLDGDTLIVAELQEIVDCVRHNIPFTLGTQPNQKIEKMSESSNVAKKILSRSNHIQTLVEASFLDLDDGDMLNYVRGCAGFVGFPKGSLTKKFIEKISSEMSSIIGDRWSEWGTEQVMSNIAIANIADTVVLPYPKYCSVDVMNDETVFIHFIGSHRFKKGIYQKKCHQYLIQQ